MSEAIQTINMENQPLYRYMTFPRLRDILERKSVGFHQICKFEDRTEYYIRKENKIFYRDGRVDDFENHIYCLCFTKTAPDSYNKLWENYASKPSAVCIETDVTSLVKCIDTNGCHSFFDHVEYADLNQSVIRYNLTNCPFDNSRFDPENPMHQLFQFAYLKDINKYRWENEARFSIISPYTNGEWLNAPLKNLDFISKIWLNPRASASDEEEIHKIAQASGIPDKKIITNYIAK